MMLSVLTQQYCVPIESQQFISSELKPSTGHLNLVKIIPLYAW
jgi:hypothetical protein